MKILQTIALIVAFSSSLFFTSFGCPFGGSEDHSLCEALDAGSEEDFAGAGYTGNFAQLDNAENVFLFTSSSVADSYDGQNVIELTRAVVEFDFEDEVDDPGDPGGFWARWRIILVPYSDALFQQIQNADTSGERRDLLSQLKADSSRIETQLSGPYQQNGCEWGDTDDIGTQTLTYSNYAIYDWDFYPGVDRLLGVIFEGDEGIGDDLITTLDISRNAGAVVLESAGQYRIELTALSNVSITP